jgi:tRNA modification GTPase
MHYADTIVAIATPLGEGGLGIIRLSGPQALEIAGRVFVPLRPGPYLPFRLRLGQIVDPARGEGRIDEAMLAYMRAPRSFTREDVVELSCHGGPQPLQATLALLLAEGARAAEPGEFTMRAFLNGRIDLAQAEATLDVIQARSAAALQLAQEQLGGWLSREVRALRVRLLAPLAYLTALVDFPEDEVEPQDIAAPLAAALADIERLLAGAQQGAIVREGARAVLVGRPNAGKSSLLNALLQHDRAIVTPIPGTTRDTLEEAASIGGVPVVLVDTAGIAETDDEVERIGVGRSARALAAADLALLVIDQGRPLHDEDLRVAELTHPKPTILVRSKADLSPRLDLAALRDGHPRIAGEVATALPSGQGLDALREAIAHTLLGGALAVDGRMVSNPRHIAALRQAESQLRAALAAHAAGVVPDLLSIDLGGALRALGTITGEEVGEDLLAEIFSRFCIGK